MATRYGVAAAELVLAGDYGRMVSLQGGSITDVPLGEAVGRIRTVPTEGALVQTARAVGVTFGDELY